MNPWYAIRALLGLLLTGALCWVLDHKLGDAPPMGRFLSPFTGFWQNMERGCLPATDQLRVPGLRAPVRVAFDDHRVAHVFAQNNADLYFAQGYLTARDRLWQMEFQTRVAAGRVSEIVGEKALELDRYQRRIGMPEAARRAAEVIMADSITAPILRAYCAGVNAWIAQLTPRELPIEYKLLDYAPERWTPVNTGLLLKLMAYDLSGSSSDYKLDNIQRAIGAAATADLFPSYPTREDPIIPVGTPLDFTPVPVPAAPGDSARTSQRSPAKNHSLTQSLSPSAPVTAFDITPDEAASIGSNNWAVSGQRSASGFPLLCNDPHLQLNLPSIWYQIQLAAPGGNACGATLPGAPTVISGFNEQVAWGVTNVGADVLDFYQLTFDGPARQRYRYGAGWKPVRRVVERIRVRGQPDRLDTVLWTHYGPVARDRAQDKPFNAQLPPGCAVRWVAHERSNELRTFYALNHAATYADYARALTHYACPAQNFVFASVQNDVAIWPNGRFPLRYPGQGKFLLDGADPGQEWAGWVPHAQNPHVLNPARGFVSSANQASTGPEYPYYLGWDWANYARGHRINEVLTSTYRATPESMMALQNDVVGINARDLLPALLPLLPAGGKPLEKQAAALLRRWDFRYAAQAPQPAIWEVWYGLLQDAIWHDELGGSDATPMRYPTRERLRRLLMEQPDTTRWFDNITTSDRRETKADVVRAAYRAALDSLAKTQGADPAKWLWWKQKSTDIKHLARLGGFGFDDVECGGGSGIVNATSERAGPSWRMVVALGPRGPQAWGVYPGGQSGNGGSPYYADQLEAWRTGKLFPLVFLHKPDEANPRVASRLEMR